MPPLHRPLAARRAGWTASSTSPVADRIIKAMQSVLIVDDDDQMRRLLRASMEQAGYEVSEGRSGREGLLRYRTAPADLVVMDILMPDKDGLEAIIELRREFPDAKVIAMTGGNVKMNIPDFLDVAKLLGAKRTLQKPFSMTEFVAVVNTELNADEGKTGEAGG